MRMAELDPRGCNLLTKIKKMQNRGIGLGTGTECERGEYASLLEQYRRFVPAEKETDGIH